MIKNHGNHYDNAKAVLGLVIVFVVFGLYAYYNANSDALQESGMAQSFVAIICAVALLLIVLFYLASKPHKKK